MLERIAKVINDYKESNLDITEETTFADLELDSLDMVELIMNLEEEFGVSIEMDGAIKTVGDLMAVLQKG
ncbi:MAG TPA: phosphopantetheine-binding protein [Oscillospiraceae bacterium]|nr:acyl carrier protein [Oscillospiraceae bacterium]HNW04184.1 phosphopantetheine-binding protein [Oscillospiraceae bacterium]HPV99924.1 phosphopantetheine-binding protein [Oscillospiraceae bacterium]